MKSIRISDEAYNFLTKIAKEEKRSFISTLDLFIQIFREGQDNEGLEEKSIPPTNKIKVKNKKQALAHNKKKSI
jgi:predicted CopG family antitoxin